MGAWATLILDCRLSIIDMLMLGDSKIVVDWLNMKVSLQVVALESWKERIIEATLHFRNLSFDYIYREDNRKANITSKKALTILPYLLSVEG